LVCCLGRACEFKARGFLKKRMMFKSPRFGKRGGGVIDPGIVQDGSSNNWPHGSVKSITENPRDKIP